MSQNPTAVSASKSVFPADPLLSFPEILMYAPGANSSTPVYQPVRPFQKQSNSLFSNSPSYVPKPYQPQSTISNSDSSAFPSWSADPRREELTEKLDLQQQQQMQQMLLLQMQQMRDLSIQESHHSTSTRPGLVRSTSEKTLDSNLLGDGHVQHGYTRNRSGSASYSQPPQKPAIIPDDQLISSILALFSATQCIFMTDADIDRHWRNHHDNKALPWWHFANGFNDFIEQWLIPRAKGALGVVIAVNRSNGYAERTRWVFRRFGIKIPDIQSSPIFLEDVEQTKIHALVEAGSEISIGELAGLARISEEFELYQSIFSSPKLANVSPLMGQVESRVRAVFDVSKNENLEKLKEDLKSVHRQCCRIVSAPIESEENEEDSDSLKAAIDSTIQKVMKEAVVVNFIRPKPRRSSSTIGGFPESTTSSATTRSNSPTTVIFDHLDSETFFPDVRWSQMQQPLVPPVNTGRTQRAVSLSSLTVPDLSPNSMRRRSDSDLSEQRGNVRVYPQGKIQQSPPNIRPGLQQRQGFRDPNTNNPIYAQNNYSRGYPSLQNIGEEENSEQIHLQPSLQPTYYQQMQTKQQPQYTQHYPKGYPQVLSVTESQQQKYFSTPTITNGSLGYDSRTYMERTPQNRQIENPVRGFDNAQSTAMQMQQLFQQQQRYILTGETQFGDIPNLNDGYDGWKVKTDSLKSTLEG